MLPRRSTPAGGALSGSCISHTVIGGEGGERMASGADTTRRHPQDFRLGACARAVEERLARFAADGFGRRLWQKDPTLWSAEPQPELADRLGWLDLPAAAPATLPELARFAGEVGDEGLRHAVVLGMGGSSLAPEVFARTFGHAGPGSRSTATAVLVHDSTHPDAVAALAREIDPARSLFLVSSKSGGTTETLSFFYTFWDRVKRAGVAGPGRHFAAITDPGTSLEALARERSFRQVFPAPPDVGGRYSAFTPFGLVPAALAGVDLAELLARGREAAEACGPGVAPAGSPGLVLGAALGELARAGRDKLTLYTSPAIRTFPDWLEQLVAESTGKNGTGIVPVSHEPLAAAAAYGPDRFFVALRVDGDSDPALERHLDALERAGHPVARLGLTDPLDLGYEIFRWTVAVAAAGAVLGIHPFNQPDVQLAKELAKKAMKEGGGAEGARGVPAADAAALAAALADLLAAGRPGGYFGIHAYLAPDPALSASLHRVQGALRDRSRLATTFGYGPRFLHSTGQLHKGGPPGGSFLQLVDRPSEAMPVPETDYTFAALIAAQARGDRAALEQRGRKVVTLDLGDDVPGGVAAIAGVLRG
jgi:transaldolase/glucose-6-phosphate isomerase